VLSLLHEIAALMGRWMESGEAGSIDIRRLPLSRAERGALTALLGAGEVDARVDALGKSRVCETGIPGVWWITHLDSASEVIGEFIEVTQTPELLSAQRQDMILGLERLHDRLQLMGRR
jgi:hydrogenase-1 operon protein HyaF